MIADKALVLLSGGQDSTTCLFWAKANFKEVVAVGFDYGQRHKNELDAAKNIALVANVPYQVMALPLLNEITDNSLTNKEIPVETVTCDNVLPNTFVEGRNLLFLSYAAIVAKGKGISHLVAGMGQTDYSGYPDCRDVFVKSINVTLNLAMDYQFIIHTPLMFKNKAETWAMADELSVLDIIRNATITCYNAIPAEGCGECPACKLRNEGLAIYLNNK